MWKIRRIDEADYGCEERMPGEKTRVLVTIENDNGIEKQFEIADDWLIEHKLDEGDIFPVDEMLENTGTAFLK